MQDLCFPSLSWPCARQGLCGVVEQPLPVLAAESSSWPHSSSPVTVTSRVSIPCRVQRSRARSAATPPLLHAIISAVLPHTLYQTHGLHSLQALPLRLLGLQMLCCSPPRSTSSFAACSAFLPSRRTEVLGDPG